MTAPEASAVPPPPSGRRRPKIRTILILAIALPLVVLILYSWLALHWDYSNGYRSGLLQKVSQKGWVCKTYEGELWQSVVANVAPNVWNFSVRDAGIAKSLDTLVGKTVRLHYTEHRGIPTSCFGDTPYYVDGVTVVTE